MSGGPSDLMRDSERSDYYIEYLEAIARFIKIFQKNGEQDKKLLDKIIKTAKMVDGVPRGYNTGQTNLSKDIDQKIQNLINQDKETWAKLLAPICSQPLEYYNIYQKLKSLSPFNDKILIYVDYGHGFVTIKGELGEFIARAIQKNKGWKTYDGDEYLLAIPLPSMEDAEITWLRCHTRNVNGPRQTNRNE